MKGQEDNTKMQELRKVLPKQNKKAFDTKNPKTQVFTKEDLAKYINAYRELRWKENY